LQKYKQSQREKEEFSEKAQRIIEEQEKTYEEMTKEFSEKIKRIEREKR
jgi:hypothetical protein